MIFLVVSFHFVYSKHSIFTCIEVYYTKWKNNKQRNIDMLLIK